MAERVSLFKQPLPGNDNSQVAPYSVETAGTTDDGYITHFSATVDSFVEAFEDVPSDYNANPNIIIQWTSGTTANNVRFSVTIRMYTMGTTILSGTTSPVARTDAITTSGKPGVSDRGEEDLINITDTDWAAARAGSYFHIKAERLATHGDDLKADVVTARFKLEYDRA